MKEKIKKYILSFWVLFKYLKITCILFNIKEKLFGYPRLKKMFKKRTGYDLDLDNPQSFNQKINWKKIHDRNPLLPVVADKYRVRDYLRSVLGVEEAERILIPLLHVTDNPETIPFDDLPEEYVIKVNHSSGANIIVEKGKPIDRQQIIDQCKIWLAQPYGLFKHEWAYQEIDRKIIIEQLLRDENGKIPKDFKFHMINAECQMIQVNQGYFADKNARSLTLFDKQWLKYDVFWEYPPADQVTAPENLDSMCLLAEKLSQPFDYVRVDLYSIRGRIFFGELTNYPTSGCAVVKPLSFDFELGARWKLTPDYWKMSKNEK